jgi:hypothetical protein
MAAAAQQHKAAASKKSKKSKAIFDALRSFNNDDCSLQHGANAPFFDRGFKDMRTQAERNRLQLWVLCFYIQLIFRQTHTMPMTAALWGQSLLLRWTVSLKLLIGPNQRPMPQRFRLGMISITTSTVSLKFAATVVKIWTSFLLSKLLLIALSHIHLAKVSHSNAALTPTIPKTKNQTRYLKRKSLPFLVLNWDIHQRLSLIPPTLSYKTKAQYEKLVKDWTSSAFLTIDGVGVPLCHWKKLYSRTRPGAWNRIKGGRVSAGSMSIGPICILHDEDV